MVGSEPTTLDTQEGIHPSGALFTGWNQASQKCSFVFRASRAKICKLILGR